MAGRRLGVHGHLADRRRAGQPRQRLHHRLHLRQPRGSRRLACGRVSPPAARRSRIRPAFATDGFGKLYLAYLRDPDGNKLCGLLPDPGRPVSFEIVSENKCARRAAAGRQARLGGDRHRHDLLDLPAAAGGRAAEAAGALVSVGPDLHARQRHREGRVSRRLRRAWHRSSSRPTPARAAKTCRTIRGTGTSARARASTSTRPRSRGRRNYRMWTYVTEELPALVAARFPGRHGPAGRSPAIRWAGTAR